MARTKLFTNMAFKEVYPGRLVHFRATHDKTGLNVDLVGLYQHVWRTQLSSEQNHIYRNDVWNKLGALLLSLPARNPLLVAGDYNSMLLQQQPHIGPAATVRSEGSTADKALLRLGLVREHNLCVLNSWVARPAHTFVESHQGRSQIDFVMTRLRDSRGLASTTFALLPRWCLANGWPAPGHRPGRDGFR